MSGGATYWVDGYNVILRLALGEGRSLEERRGELIARVGALGKPAWIAFDSRERVHGVAVSAPRRVRVAFATGGRSADDLILEKVRTAKDLNGVVVVSDDREVASRCQFMGARTMGTAEFGRMLKPATAAETRPDRKLTPNEVNDWMKWFGENAKRNPNQGGT
jgi:predicted RNA-binding protein with PIN domain